MADNMLAKYLGTIALAGGRAFFCSDRVAHFSLICAITVDEISIDWN